MPSDLPLYSALLTEEELVLVQFARELDVHLTDEGSPDTAEANVEVLWLYALAAANSRMPESLQRANIVLSNGSWVPGV